MSRHGYFNFYFNPELATTLRHSLNHKYKGSRPFELQAPDAQGTLVVHARYAEEADEHVVNALFDLIFNRSRVGASIDNPACIFCGYRTESRGRNSSGTRGWRCLSRDCRRSFVLNRSFRGGLNHPSQSKKPAFFRLIYRECKTVREAADALDLNMDTAQNWADKMEAINGKLDARCPCGKPVRHRGTCRFRLTYKKLRRHEATRESLGEITRPKAAGESA
jgi:hypothetical protein